MAPIAKTPIGRNKGLRGSVGTDTYQIKVVSSTRPTGRLSLSNPPTHAAFLSMCYTHFTDSMSSQPYQWVALSFLVLLHS
jgi:hypothetical protein